MKREVVSSGKEEERGALTGFFLAGVARRGRRCSLHGCAEPGDHRRRWPDRSAGTVRLGLVQRRSEVVKSGSIAAQIWSGWTQPGTSAREEQR